MESGFYFQHSNDIKRLADALLMQVLRLQTESPLEPVTIVVPHVGVGIWLTQHLAERTGSAANLEFILPTTLIWRLAEDTHSDEEIRRVRDLDAESLTMAVYSALDGMVGVDLFDETYTLLREYLSDAAQQSAAPDKVKLSLARQMARIYRDYMYYRPDWIDQWSRTTRRSADNGDSVASWQAPLWRAVLDRIWADRAGSENPGRVLLDIPHRLAKGGRDEIRAPILLFGIAHLPPTFLDILAAATRHRPVRLYMPNPCEAYWGDVTSERARLKDRLSDKVESAGQRSDDQLVDDLIANDLLGALGHQGQVFLAQVAERMDDQLDWQHEVGYRTDFATETRLGWLKSAMLQLEPPDSGQAIESDASVQLHDTHSRLREVEVLHDQILGWLDREGRFAEHRYRPRDILVVAPEIDQYAPYIRAVFGADIGESPRLAFNISDRRAIDSHPLAQAFLDLLELPISDFASEKTMATLETPAMARRFDLTASELELIRHWLAQTHVHWGLDEAHREQLGAGPGSRANTWQHVVDRLLMGLAVNQQDELVRTASGPVLAYSALEGSDSEAAGKLSLWLSALRSVGQEIQKSRTARQWQQYLHGSVISAFFAIDPTNRDERQAHDAVLSAVASVVRAADGGSCENLNLSWVVIRDMLETALANDLATRRFLSRGITFANMVPLRQVPARIVCLLGLNSGEFPHPDTRPTFDLMRSSPRPGDRSRRDEDRYLFLETMLAAQDILYLSYVGRDQRLNDPIEPSPLVREIEDILERAGMPLEVCQHPLQPFSKTAFLPPVENETSYAAWARWSHKRRWLPAAKSLGEGIAIGDELFFEPPNALPDLPSTLPSQVRLDELCRFLGGPLEWYARQVLRLDSRESSTEGALDEEFQTDGLSSYLQAERMLELASAGEEIAWRDLPPAIDVEAGWLPDGHIGRALLQRNAQIEMVEALKERVNGREPGREKISIELPVGEKVVTVVGSIGDIYRDPAEWITHAPGAFHGRRIAKLLPQWLALNCVIDEPINWFHVARDAETHRFAADAVDARGWLTDLVDLFLRSHNGPIAFFPKTAWLMIEGKSEYVITKSIGDELSHSAITKRFTAGWEEHHWSTPVFHQVAALIFSPLKGRG